MLDVGRIDRAHGLGGDVVVDLWTNVESRLEPGTVLATDRGDLRVLSARPFRGRFLVQFEAVDDRRAADALHGLVLRAPAVDEPGALWIDELIGAQVVDPGGRVLGRVEAVEPNPASDLLVLEDGGLVPLRFVVEHVPGVRVVVDGPAGLFE
jgi:16S rRNA processing protein RimM